MMESEPVRVVAAVVTKGDRALVCQRPTHKRHGGLWEFPGGKCEVGESDLEALTRELGEELGVVVVDASPAEVVLHDAGSPYHIAFIPTVIRGQPLCHEHMALVWGTMDELLRLPLAPSDRRYMEWRLRQQSGIVERGS